jgi:hypothetical protein
MTPTSGASLLDPQRLSSDAARSILPSASKSAATMSVLDDPRASLAEPRPPGQAGERRRQPPTRGRFMVGAGAGLGHSSISA